MTPKEFSNLEQGDVICKGDEWVMITDTSWRDCDDSISGVATYHFNGNGVDGWQIVSKVTRVDVDQGSSE